jgi:hypothetical protein
VISELHHQLLIQYPQSNTSSSVERAPETVLKSIDNISYQRPVGSRRVGEAVDRTPTGSDRDQRLSQGWEAAERDAMLDLRNRKQNSAAVSPLESPYTAALPRDSQCLPRLETPVTPSRRQ